MHILHVGLELAAVGSATANVGSSRAFFLDFSHVSFACFIVHSGLTFVLAAYVFIFFGWVMQSIVFDVRVNVRLLMKLRKG